MVHKTYITTQEEVTTEGQTTEISKYANTYIPVNIKIQKIHKGGNIHSSSRILQHEPFH